MRPTLEDLAPTAPSVIIDVPREFNYGPTVLQPAFHVNGKSKNGHHEFKNGHHKTTEEPKGPPPPPLDALAEFKGTFSGYGFNTIFRPASKKTPTQFDKEPTDPINDNLLQLNLTGETQVFGDLLTDVPNRGLFEQADITLIGLPYTQTIVDAMPPPPGKTAPENPPGIHFEPGLWMRVPKVEEMPELPMSFCRMGSIPHGTTINAQGFDAPKTNDGAPSIPEIDITPIRLPLGPGPVDVEIKNNKRRFNSQNADDDRSRRLPQDLALFMENGTITQEILNDPNTILRQANKGKNIVQNSMFTVSTNAPAGKFGGGTSNIGFNIGADAGQKRDAKKADKNGNANAVDVTAQYWVSKIHAEVELDPGMRVGQTVSPAAKGPRDAVPEFYIDKDVKIPAERKTVTVAYSQIQYSQMVFLDFNGVKWPHVSVATLAPVVQAQKPTLSSAIEAAKA
ncbi:uncharacterized protein B0J16DRAFT_274701 [Fusarium flagelliforme]|uniref:Uncharacterized protein n=1 Tax=Fusarium flagelliforme TaxID=2675880 RepID=A0A395MGV0_9HYPO|nr:uncharacterized protein B0J16DRAFT_274701 [Fusarium flagelliforme]KAH7174413.1 hypothetical protein B0J16DRAFT_274701 [Fusarium flagelliforme]RFN47148.1 hypothetical protein FIE12Z_8604 [Fusarium flagelliforme]